jgi:hypothetical protein
MEEQQQEKPITNDYLIDQQRRLIAAMQARAILDPFSGQKITCNGDIFAHYPKIYQIASAIDGLKTLCNLVEPQEIAQNEEKNNRKKPKN